MLKVVKLINIIKSEVIIKPQLKSDKYNNNNKHNNIKLNLIK